MTIKRRQFLLRENYVNCLAAAEKKEQQKYVGFVFLSVRFARRTRVFRALKQGSLALLNEAIKFPTVDNVLLH